MFKVVVHVQCAAADGTLWGRRTIQLPFPPYPGLALTHITDEPIPVDIHTPGDGGLIVARVEWSVRAGEFRLTMDDHDQVNQPATYFESVYGPEWAWHFVPCTPD